MQVFIYKAVTPEGTVVQGEIAGEGQPGIHATLAERRLTLVDLRQHRTRIRWLARGGGDGGNLIEFSRSLASLLTAGIPLIVILEDLEEQTDNKDWQRLLRDLHLRVSGGSTLHEAFAAHPRVFSAMYCSLVEAGEVSGQLPETFVALTRHLEWSRNLRDELRHAVTYPLVVLSAVAVLIGILTFFVFPRLGEVLYALGLDLPLPTRVILAIGGFAQRYWPVAVATPVVLALAFNHLRRRPRGRRALDLFKLNAPVVGRLFQMVVYSRLAGTLATLLSAGIQLNRALTLVRGVVGNSVVATAIAHVEERIESGDTLAEAFARAHAFPKILIRMTRVGEGSGDVPGMLQRCAEHYDRLIPVAIRKLLSAFGPAMVVFLALTVGVAAFSIFLPLLHIGAALQQ